MRSNADWQAWINILKNPLFSKPPRGNNKHYPSIREWIWCNLINADIRNRLNKLNDDDTLGFDLKSAGINLDQLAAHIVLALEESPITQRGEKILEIAARINKKDLGKLERSLTRTLDLPKRLKEILLWRVETGREEIKLVRGVEQLVNGDSPLEKVAKVIQGITEDLKSAQAIIKSTIKELEEKSNSKNYRMKRLRQKKRNTVTRRKVAQLMLSQLRGVGKPGGYDLAARVVYTLGFGRANGETLRKEL